MCLDPAGDVGRVGAQVIDGKEYALVPKDVTFIDVFAIARALGEDFPKIATVSKAAKSPEWAKVRQQRGWDDAYLEGDAFAAFLKMENARVKDILTTLGLVK